MDHFLQSLVRPILTVSKDVLLVLSSLITIFLQPKMFIGGTIRAASLAISMFVSKRVHTVGEQRNRLEEKRYQLLTDGIRGSLDIITNKYQHYFHSAFKVAVANTAKNIEQVQFLRFIANISFETVVFTCFVFFFFGITYLSYDFIDIEHILVSAIIIIMRLRPSFQNIISGIASIKYGLSI